MRINGAWVVCATAVMVLGLAACGDDDTETDAGSESSGSSKGGSGGKAAAGEAGSESAGESGESAGSGGASGARAGSGATTPPAGMMMTCTEEPPSEPLKCGDETCTPPEFPNNPCIVPCCLNVGGVERCAAKSTSEMFPTACVLPAVEDPSCPELDAMGTPLPGCCNVTEKKCGIVSTLRPGCITQSTLVTFPDPLQSCEPPLDDTDAGVEEPDAG